MGVGDIVVIILVAAAAIAALTYLLMQKKKGRKCIGCPYSESCTKCDCDTKKKQ